MRHMDIYEKIRTDVFDGVSADLKAISDDLERLSKSVSKIREGKGYHTKNSSRAVLVGINQVRRNTIKEIGALIPKSRYNIHHATKNWYKRELLANSLFTNQPAFHVQYLFLKCFKTSAFFTNQVEFDSEKFEYKLRKMFSKVEPTVGSRLRSSLDTLMGNKWVWVADIHGIFGDNYDSFYDEPIKVAAGIVRDFLYNDLRWADRYGV